jgi:hypothetical protein
MRIFAPDVGISSKTSHAIRSIRSRKCKKLSFSISRHCASGAGKFIHCRAADLAADNMRLGIYHGEFECHPAGDVSHRPAPA